MFWPTKVLPRQVDNGPARNNRVAHLTPLPIRSCILVTCNISDSVSSSWWHNGAECIPSPGQFPHHTRATLHNSSGGWIIKGDNRQRNKLICICFYKETISRHTLLKTSIYTLLSTWRASENTFLRRRALNTFVSLWLVTFCSGCSTTDHKLLRNHPSTINQKTFDSVKFPAVLQEIRSKGYTNHA